MVMLMALLHYPPPQLSNSNFMLAAMFMSAQSGLSGFLIGVLFQNFYSESKIDSADALVPLKTAA